MIYTGGTYSCDKMADLYRAADVYAAPYRAEGFNLPVLEAAACGVPVSARPADRPTNSPIGLLPADSQHAGTDDVER